MQLSSTTRCLALLLAIAAGACGEPPPAPGSAASAPPAPAPQPATMPAAAAVTAQRIIEADAEPHNWLSHGRSYAEQRFSPLDQINDGNVAQLGLAWYFPLQTRHGVEATPLVIDGVIYLSGAWNVIHALDARTGAELWRYDPQTRRDWLRHACCGAANRGLAAWGGLLYEGTFDGRLIAVDRATGALAWEVQTTDPEQDYSITGAPRVVNGKVIIGNGGADLGVRGYVTAYDADTGAQVWRFWTVPGNPADGFESPVLEMAARTWTGEWWKFGGGGTAWDAFAFDPELNLLYIGVGNGAPWMRALRSPGGGDNLFLSSIVAVDADTGAYRWHYQTTPADTWDYTAVQQMVLAELPIGGRPRKVLMQAPKNGFFYVLDRATGELLSANAYVPTTWASHVDLATGRPVEIAENMFSPGQPRVVSPSPAGGHNWQPMAYSPQTGLVYIPKTIGAYVYSVVPGEAFAPRRGQWNMGNDPDAVPPPEAARIDNRGFLTAWDPVAGRSVWEHELGAYWQGGALATAGNLVFQGRNDARFVAYAADDGRPLWDMPVHSAPMAGPVSYAVDGEQYVAVAVGWTGAVALWGGNRERAAREPVEARLLAFKLGGTASLPPEPGLRAFPEPPPPAAPADVVARGKRLYDRTCNVCHGLNAVGGVIADLRAMSTETHAQFAAIVLGGSRSGDGMPGFADKHTLEEVQAIHAYLIARANEDWPENRQRMNTQGEPP